MQGAFISSGAGFFVIVQVGAVDVLGNVFGDIARGIPLGRGYLFPVKAGCEVGKWWGALDIPYPLVVVIGQGIALQNADHPGPILRAHKQQQVPVRGAVVVALSDPRGGGYLSALSKQEGRISQANQGVGPGSSSGCLGACRYRAGQNRWFVNAFPLHAM